MFSNEIIHFEKPNSVGPLLGFNKQVYEAYKTHKSENLVNINSVNIVRILCNVVRGSYQNGSEGHILHEFYPSVPPGFKIIETPHNVIYLPVNVQKLTHITCEFRDQSGKLINFRDETISLRLHLRQRDGTSI